MGCGLSTSASPTTPSRHDRSLERLPWSVVVAATQEPAAAGRGDDGEVRASVGLVGLPRVGKTSVVESAAMATDDSRVAWRRDARRRSAMLAAVRVSVVVTASEVLAVGMDPALLHAWAGADAVVAQRVAEVAHAVADLAVGQRGYASMPREAVVAVAFLRDAGVFERILEGAAALPVATNQRLVPVNAHEVLVKQDPMRLLMDGYDVSARDVAVSRVPSCALLEAVVAGVRVVESPGDQAVHPYVMQPFGASGRELMHRMVLVVGARDALGSARVMEANQAKWGELLRAAGAATGVVVEVGILLTQVDAVVAACKSNADVGHALRRVVAGVLAAATHTHTASVRIDVVVSACNALDPVSAAVALRELASSSSSWVGPGNGGGVGDDRHDDVYMCTRGIAAHEDSGLASSSSTTSTSTSTSVARVRWTRSVFASGLVWRPALHSLFSDTTRRRVEALLFRANAAKPGNGSAKHVGKAPGIRRLPYDVVGRVFEFACDVGEL